MHPWSQEVRLTLKVRDELGERTMNLRLKLWCLLVCSLAFSGCAWFTTQPHSEVPPAEQPLIAVLPFGIDVAITSLSSIQSRKGEAPAEEEAQQLEHAIEEICADGRWLFQSRLATKQHFRFVPAEQVDAAVAAIALKPGSKPSPSDLAALRTQLDADLIVGASILDYGKVRWQWLATGMLMDTTAETIALGLATAWNPAAMLANVGFNLLTSTPVWFGGGYLFGLGMRPVRVESWATETVHGEEVWDGMEVAVYLWNELKALPLEVRAKKEIQLKTNLAKVMEALADSMSAQKLTMTDLQKRQGQFEAPYKAPWYRMWSF